MGDERDRVINYVSWLVSGLVACAVIAVTLHTDAAAATLLAGATLVVAHGAPRSLSLVHDAPGRGRIVTAPVLVIRR